MHFLRKYIASFIDCVLPPREAELQLRKLTPNNFPFIKSEFKTESGMSVLTLSVFTDERVRLAIHELKFHNNSHAASLYSENVHDALKEVCSRSNLEYLIVPIPLHKKRYRARGYNQVVTIIMSALSKGTEHPLNTIFSADALTRIRETKPQTELSRESRLKNLHHAFSASSEVRDRNVIVVDDVYTTGATCAEAQRALMYAGARSVTCIVLARA